MSGKKQKKTTYQRFEAKIEKNQNWCWIWTGAKDASGYGKFQGDEKVMTPHKYSYEHHSKKLVPKGSVVKHTCDQPLCVNPDHLSIGTYRDNAKERWERSGKRLQPAETISRAITRALPGVSSDQLKAALKALGLDHAIEASEKQA